MKTTSRWRPLRPAAIAAAVLLVLPGCDLGLETINVDPTRLTSVDPRFQLNNVIVQSPNLNAAWRCEASIVQQHFRMFTGVASCGNFNTAHRGNMSSNWTNGYQTRMRGLLDVIDATQNDPQRQNLYNMARIMRAYTMMRITDSYGNVPYTEAARAFTEGVVFPQYDTQEFIYTSPQGILEELKNASAALSAGGGAVAEPLYNGNIQRWQRFGNSLLLRAAMRLTKVNPDLARQYVQAAVNNPGGLIQSNAENAVILHTNDYRNSMGVTMNSNEGFNEYTPEAFVNYLVGRGDPRARSIFVRYPNASSSAQQTVANQVFDPARQVGAPMGLDNNRIQPVVQQLGLPSLFAFTQTDRRRMLDVLAPNFLVTYSQTQLLLAEAVHRGWVSGNVATHYNNAVRADMQRISTSYTNTAITNAEIDAFLAANPFNPAGNVLRQINEEYWVASFVIPDENWANFRRSCWPILPANAEQGDLPPNEMFMRRFLYPESEIDLNPNYQTGATMPDNLGTRVWWDVRVNERC
jgi:hypothetical protein